MKNKNVFYLLTFFDFFLGDVDAAWKGVKVQFWPLFDSKKAPKNGQKGVKGNQKKTQFKSHLDLNKSA